jgi:oxalate decarboxylase
MRSVRHLPRHCDIPTRFLTGSPYFEPKDDIGIVAAVNSLPRDFLSAVLGIPIGVLNTVPQNFQPVVITSKNP